MTAPHVLAALDQLSAAARTLTEDVARMWITYQAAGLPEDLAGMLVAQYHRVACGGPIDPPAVPITNTYNVIDPDYYAPEEDADE